MDELIAICDGEDYVYSARYRRGSWDLLLDCHITEFHASAPRDQEDDGIQSIIKQYRDWRNEGGRELQALQMQYRLESGV